MYDIPAGAWMIAIAAPDILPFSCYAFKITKFDFGIITSNSTIDGKFFWKWACVKNRPGCCYKVSPHRYAIR